MKADGSVLADESTEQGDKIYFKNDCGYNLQVDWVSGGNCFDDCFYVWLLHVFAFISRPNRIL